MAPIITAFDALPDPVFAYITEFSHRSLIDVSKTLSQRYRQLHAKTDPQVVGNILVEGLTKGFSWQTIERLKALSTRVFAIYFDFGAQRPGEFSYCANFMNAITLFPHLQEVRLRGRYVNDYCVREILKNCPNLRALSVKNSDEFTTQRFRDTRYAGDAPPFYFQPFPSMLKLKCLQVSNCRYFKTISVIESHALSLERVEITGCPIIGFNNYRYAADTIRQFCRRPTTRYLKISHFYRIDALFYKIRQEHPHLVVEEEHESLAQRRVYKIQDSLRDLSPILVPIISVAAGLFGYMLLEILD